MRSSSLSDDEHSLAYPGWRVALGAAVGVFSGFASLLVYTFGVFLKPLAETFAWSREEISAAFGIAAITVAICSPGLGFLLDRVGPRRVVVPCVAIFGLAFASLSLLDGQLLQLYATFVVLGIVGNGTAQMAYSRSVTSWFEARRGTALAMMMCGGAVGAMILPPLAESLIANHGWRTAFRLLGAGVLLIGLPTVALSIREKPQARAGSTIVQAGATLSEGLRSRPFWILVVVLFFSSIGQNAAIAHMSALLTDRGVSAAGGAFAIAAMGGASLIGRMTTGWLLDRFLAARVSFGLQSLSALGVFILSWADSLTAGVIAAGLIGFGMGGEADVTPYLLSRYYGLRAFSMLYGLTWTAYAIAGATGPILMGKVYDATGSYEMLLVMLSWGTLAVAALMLLLPRYDRTPSPYFTGVAVRADAAAGAEPISDRS